MAKLRSGLLDAGRIQSTDQCLGNLGDQAVPGTLDGSPPGALSTDLVGQCHGSGLC